MAAGLVCRLALNNFKFHIPVVEMIFSRDSTVYHFDPIHASLLYGKVQSRAGVRQGDPLSPLLFNLAISSPSRILVNCVRIHPRLKPSLTMAST
jgi:hypothetical protein